MYGHYLSEREGEKGVTLHLKVGEREGHFPWSKGKDKEKKGERGESRGWGKGQYPLRDGLD